MILCVYILSSSECVFAVCLCVSTYCLMAAIVYFIFPKGAPEMLGQESTFVFVLQRGDSARTHSHSYQMCRIHAAIHKHDLLVILVSSFFFVFLSALASDVLSWLCMREKQLPRDPLSFFFHCSLPLLTHCQQVSCYSVWTRQFPQTMQMFCSPLTFLWHFSELCGEKTLGGQLSRNTSFISSTHVPQLSSEQFKFCQPQSDIISTSIWRVDLVIFSCAAFGISGSDVCTHMFKDVFENTWMGKFRQVGAHFVPGCLSLSCPRCLLHFSFPVTTHFQPFD